MDFKGMSTWQFIGVVLVLLFPILLLSDSGYFVAPVGAEAIGFDIGRLLFPLGLGIFMVWTGRRKKQTIKSKQEETTKQ